ncbi:MAG: bifunctional metallophosphatase/5'-nucleotidase [Gemmatimonadales bacterium]|nr:MAG: bifunctional metallophosphatase/5'-nucleotidase [Gemmatimonadales bacterium]
MSFLRPSPPRAMPPVRPRTVRSPSPRRSGVLPTLLSLALLATPGALEARAWIAPADTTTASPPPPSTDVVVMSVYPHGDHLHARSLKRVTNRDGYDNQPSFLDEDRLLFSSAGEGGATDILRYSTWDEVTDAVTRTPESEYSPRLMPAGDAVSVVRVEMNGVSQHLVRYPLDGGPAERLLPELDDIGYYAWVDERRVALFRLGDPPSLHIADITTGEVEEVVQGIGPVLQSVPGETAVSFVRPDDQGDGWVIHLWDGTTGETQELSRTPGPEPDHVWLSSATLLAIHDGVVYRQVAEAPDGWHPVLEDLRDVFGQITRLAVSPSGTRWAVVVDHGAGLENGTGLEDGPGGDGSRDPEALTPLRLTLLHTNDEHSQLLPFPLADHDPDGGGSAVGGFARLASAVEAVRDETRAREHPVILVSAGDFLGGTPFAWLGLLGMAPELEVMAELGYDAVTLGNHEFDWGPELLARYLTQAGYPNAQGAVGGREDEALPALVASNLSMPQGHSLARSGVHRTTLIELDNGLRVGILGLLGRNAASLAPLMTPVALEAPETAARRAVDELRGDGAHLIIALSHSGEPEDLALAAAVEGIDLVVGGHFHTPLAAPLREGDTWIVQAGSSLRYLGRVELLVHPGRDEGRVEVVNAEEGVPFLTPLDSSIPASDAVAERIRLFGDSLNAFLARYTDGVAQDFRDPALFAHRTLGRGPVLSETALGNFVADAMRAAAGEATGEAVDFAFQANGVLRSDLVPAVGDRNRGAVTVLDLATVSGLGAGPDGTPGYPIISARLTGEEIHRILEISTLVPQLRGNSHFLQVSGLRYEVDPSRAILFTLPVRGTPIPSFRAVRRAWQVHPDGTETEIPRDHTLFHVATDHHVASFLPQVGELAPRLRIELKDAHGRPIVHLDDAVIRRDGREVKVWEALLRYAATLPVVDGHPTLPEAYHGPEGRIVERAGLPVVPLTSLALLLAAVGVTGTAVMRRRRR